MTDLSAVNKLQSMQHLVGQILEAVSGNESLDVKKMFQSSAERLMNGEMIIAVTLIELQVVQCLPDMLFPGPFR